jgi:hypothetical protein
MLAERFVVACIMCLRWLQADITQAVQVQTNCSQHTAKHCSDRSLTAVFAAHVFPAVAAGVPGPVQEAHHVQGALRERGPGSELIEILKCF